MKRFYLSHWVRSMLLIFPLFIGLAVWGQLAPRELSLTDDIRYGSMDSADVFRAQAATGLPIDSVINTFEGGGASCFENGALKYLSTPHIDWAEPYANGPVRVLYIVNPSDELRDPIELMQRADYQYTVLQVPQTLWNYTPNDQALINWWHQKLVNVVQNQTYDVIVISRSSCYVPAELLNMIAIKVQNGCGLVCFNNFTLYNALRSDSFPVFQTLTPIHFTPGLPMSGTVGRGVGHPLTDGLSFGLWPTVCTSSVTSAVTGAQVLASESGYPIIATSTCGAGRTVCISYQTEKYNGAGLLPLYDIENNPRYGKFDEPVYATWLRAIAWAANKAPRVGVTASDTLACTVGNPATAILTLSGTDLAPLTATVALYDPWGDAISGSTVMHAPANTVTITTPTLRLNGMHHLYYWIQRGTQVENWGTVALNVTGGVTFALTGTIPDTGPLGGTVSYTLTTGGQTGALTVCGIDDLDRIFTQTTTANFAGGNISVDLTKSLTPINRVEFTFTQGGTVTGALTRRLTIPRIGMGALHNEFLIGVYAWASEQSTLAKYLGDIYRAAGVNTAYVPSHLREYLSKQTELGLFSITGASGAYLTQRDLNATELANCPNKAATISNWQAANATVKTDVERYGAIGKVLEDEGCWAVAGSLSAPPGQQVGAQICQCSGCTAAFRAEMQTKYGTIAALNAAWGTNYAQFSEIPAITESSVVNGDNPSRWVEFREFMNKTYATKYYGWYGQQFSDPVSPAYLATDFGVGAGAPCWASQYGPTYLGGDYSQLKSALHWTMGYGNRDDAEALPTSFICQQASRAEWSMLHNWQFGPWQQLFSGAKGVWFYNGCNYFGNEISWRRHTQWLAESVRDIRGGVGVLVRDATPQNTQVRILYSPENYAMEWLNSKRSDQYQALGIDLTTRNMQTLFRQLLNIQPSYITEDEIQDGTALTGCKLLILPMATNLDDATITAITNYVNNGGCVLADFLPGTRTRLGKLRGGSALAGLFGVSDAGSSYHRECTNDTNNTALPRRHAGLHVTNNGVPNLNTWRAWLPT
ncbi:MAG TPA: alpha-amylase family protein, partial [Armatimonadota bacterium]